jgi:hypothetical protein
MFAVIAAKRADTKCSHVSAITSRNENADIVVILTAWHFDEDDEAYLQSEQIIMPNFNLARCFVDDFSEASAQAFIEGFNF